MLALVPAPEVRAKAARFLDRVDQVKERIAQEAAPAYIAPIDPTEVLSPSSLNLYLDCSARWHYRKVLQLPETRGAALGLGTAVHEAIAVNFAQKVETKEDLPTEGVSALFLDAMDRQLDEIVLEKDESADELKTCGEVMTRVYMEQIAPRIQPAAVELHVSGLIGDVPVQGYIDVLDVNGTIIDLKTAKKKPSGINAGYRVQIATYAMLEPRASGAARLDTITKTKTVVSHEQSLQVGEADRKYATRMYSIAQEQMRSGVVAPNRGSFLCSRKYCSFADSCESDFGGQVE